MTAEDDVQRIAAALERPRDGYVRRLEAVRTAVTAGAGEAARQLGLFLERIEDLTTEELCELYDETFRREHSATIEPLVTRLTRRRTRPPDWQAALSVLAPLLDRLEADRNPFAHVVRALCLLMVRSEPARLGPGRQP